MVERRVWHLRSGRLAGLLLALLAVCAASARAAEVNVTSVDGANLVALTGEIAAGDSAKFELVAGPLTGRTMVVLDSPGGLTGESLVIGEIIHAKGYATAVANGARCLSGCGLLWLAGKTRYVGTTARIGFHAAYRRSGDDLRESGVGNALVGAYLTRLGFTDQVVAFVTSAPPAELKWLHPADARQLGIAYVAIAGLEAGKSSSSPSPTPPAPSSAPAPSAPALAQLAGTPLEWRVTALVSSYYAAWSDWLGTWRHSQTGATAVRPDLFSQPASPATCAER